MKLQDSDYEDENGHRISRSEVEVIGTFTYKADGFFEWDCGGCGKEHASRAFKIAGVVFRCQGCRKLNLLTRTDYVYIGQIIRNAERRDSDLDKRFRSATYHLGQAVMALGER